MDSLWRTALWEQFGAAIDMLENAMVACPDTLWHGRLWGDPSDPSLPADFAAFWYITYHTLFWLDMYLTGSTEEFAPPPPFTLSELEAGVLPERSYGREELHIYLLHLRQKCQSIIAELSDERAHQLVDYPWRKKPSYLELLLYTMRHVQEHAAQLNMFLGQHAIEGTSGWVHRAKANAGSE